MSAITRWVKYDIDAVGAAGDGNGEGCVGTRGYSFGIGTVSTADGISIGPTTNRLYVNIDGHNPPGSYITLYSGSLLDPRFIARDITEKLHNVDSANERWANAVCVWDSGDWLDASGEADNRFRIYSGTLGTSSSVTVATSGTNTAHAVLGWDSKQESGGAATSNTFNGTASVSGTYYGLYDEIYTVMMSNDNNGGSTRGIGALDKTNIVYGGDATIGGVYTGSSDRTYQIDITVTNGTTMGAGTGNVPLMRWWVSTGAADDMGAGKYTELLYSNHWYKVGN